MNTTSNIVQRIACKAVIAHKGKILILREASTYADGSNVGKWHLPGGRLNPGEPFLEGLNREVLEETGLVVEVGDILYAGEWFPVIREVPNQIVAMFFACESSSADVTLSEEHDMFKWISANEMGDYTIMDPDPVPINKFFTSLL